MLEINNIIDPTQTQKYEDVKKAVELINRAAELLQGLGIALSDHLNETNLTTDIQTKL